MIAFSPDRPDQLVDSLDVEDLGYALYSDARMNASRALGIAFRVTEVDLAKYRSFGIDLEAASGEDHHLLPVPSVFLVNKGGEVLWTYSDPDYKVRPDNATLLEAARAAADGPEIEPPLAPGR